MIKIRLKEILKKKKMTITEVHEKTGISRSTLTLLANQESKGIQFETLDKLCDVFSAQPNDIISYSSDKTFDFMVIKKRDSTRPIEKSSWEIFLIKKDFEGIYDGILVFFSITRGRIDVRELGMFNLEFALKEYGLDKKDIIFNSEKKRRYKQNNNGYIPYTKNDFFNYSLEVIKLSFEHLKNNFIEVKKFFDQNNRIFQVTSELFTKNSLYPIEDAVNFSDTDKRQLARYIYSLSLPSYTIVDDIHIEEPKKDVVNSSVKPITKIISL